MAHTWLDDDSIYTPELIRRIAVAIGRANAWSFPDNCDKDMLPILERSLGQLEKAEAMMDEAQTNYFRRYLVLFITRFP
jgi:hypothetical protein